MNALPIARHREALDAVLAGPAGPVGAACFFAQATRLARALPQAGHVINLCETRHGFMLGFAAALIRGQVSLLPPGRGRGDWEALALRHGDAHVLSESAVDGARNFVLAGFLEDRATHALDIPRIDAASTAAILFTSGSTGEPAAHPKSWGQLCRGAQLLAQALRWEDPFANAIVGSVPPQHMFGLEATVMLPWQSGIPVHSQVPLLAADLEAALRECARPAWWMATPMHLRAPLQATAAMSGLQGVVASTMSLPQALAKTAEAAWRVPVIEVYGSTETGALATRRTAIAVDWTPLAGVVLRSHGEGDAARIRAEGPHIDQPVDLGDLLELHDDGGFRWLGRAADLVKVAGKRASLAALNLALTEIPGIDDGAFSFPPDATGVPDESHPPRRLAAFFVSRTLDAPQVVAALRARIDPAFLPRPVHRVSRLPRNARTRRRSPPTIPRCRGISPGIPWCPARSSFRAWPMPCARAFRKARWVNCCRRASMPRFAPANPSPSRRRCSPGARASNCAAPVPARGATRPSRAANGRSGTGNRESRSRDQRLA